MAAHSENLFDPRQQAIINAARLEQSTHNVVTSNAAAQLAIRLASDYLFKHNATAASSSTEASPLTTAQSICAEGDSQAERFIKTISELYVNRKKHALLTDVAKAWLGQTLASRKLNTQLDRVTLQRMAGDSVISEEWYLPLPEVYAIVLSALTDISKDRWPVPDGSSDEQERRRRLQEFDRVNNALAVASPSICATGIRHAWLMALDGFEGKRLPLNAEDVLMQGLFDFIVRVVLEQNMAIKLPQDKDPKGDERQLFNDHFQSLFLPWLFKGMPTQVKDKIADAGGPMVAKTFVLARFDEISVIPDSNMMERIEGHCSMAGLEAIPCNFTPLLATLCHNTALQLAAAGHAPIGTTRFARDIIDWLNGPDFSPGALAAKDSFATVYRLVRLLDALHKYQTYKNLLNLNDLPKTEHPAWEDSLHFLADCLDNRETSLNVLLTDTSALKSNLRAFERGFAAWRNNNSHDIISNYFASWFAASGDAGIPERANLFTTLCELFFRENSQAPAIYVSDATLEKWTSRLDQDGRLEITPYQINRILLHALCYPKMPWSETFRSNLGIVLQFLHNRLNDAQSLNAQALGRDSYPENLLQQVEKIAAGDVLEYPPPVLSPGDITPDTSLEMARLLAASPHVPESVIRNIVHHEDFKPDAQGDEGLTPFYLAAEYGHVGLGKALFERNVNHHAKFQGYRPFEIAWRNISFLQWYLGVLSPDEKFAAMTKGSRTGNTVLHQAANSPQSLEILLNSLSKAERAKAVRATNNMGVTVLNRVATVPQSLEILLNCLSKTDRAAALEAKDNNDCTVLHRAAHIPGSLEILLALLPEPKRSAAVKMKDSFGRTVLHFAARVPNSVRMLLNCLPEPERPAAVMMKNREGDTVLNLAANHPESLKILLDCLPESERAAAVMMKNRDGDTMLHLAKYTALSLEILLNALPESEWAAAVMTEDRYGGTVLNLAANHPESLKILLDCLPESKRAAAVMMKNRDGDTILHLAEHTPKSLEILLNALPESKRAAAVMTKDSDGGTVLHQVLETPESLEVILNCLPKHERAATVMAKNNDGDTLLHLAANHPQSLEVILNRLPKHERAVAVRATNALGQTVLDRASNNPESMRLLNACQTDIKKSRSSSPIPFFSSEPQAQCSVSSDDQNHSPKRPG